MNDSYFDEINREKQRKAAIRNKQKHFQGKTRMGNILRSRERETKGFEYGKKTLKRKIRFSEAMDEKYSE